MTKKLIIHTLFMINNIIFDFDGVLVDSEILASKAFSRYLSNKNIQLSGQEFSNNYSGNKLIEAITMIASRFKINDQEIFFKEIMALSQKLYTEELEPVKGAAEFLQVIDQRKLIGSNRGKQSITEGLTKANLIKYFDRKNIFSFDMVDNSKPEPDIFIKAVKDCNLKSSETIIIEDSVIGVQAGVAANIKVIGLTSGKHWINRSTETLIEAGALFVVTSFDDVLKIIKEL